MSRSTNVEVISRTDIIYRLLLLGLRRSQVYDHLDRKYRRWGCATRTLDRYLAAARELMVEEGAAERPLEKGRAAARLHDLYAFSRSKGNVTDCIAVIRLLVEIFGLKEPIEVNINDARRELAELLAQEVWDEAEQATAEAAAGD